MVNPYKNGLLDSLSYYARPIFDKALVNKDFIRLTEALGDLNKIYAIIPTKSAKAFILAMILPFTSKKIAVITPGEDEAASFKEDLDTFLEFLYKDKVNNILLPQHPAGFDSRILTDQTLEARRLQCIKTFVDNSSPFIVTGSQKAFSRKTIPRDIFERRTIRIEVGKDYDLDNLQTFLLENGYTKEVNVETVSGFALRGGILDVFAPTEKLPNRIDFLGDSVESIKYFNPDTQRSQQNDTESLDIIPAKEIIMSPDSIEYAKNSLKELTDSLDIPKKKRKVFLDSLNEGNYSFGIEALLPAFYEKPETVFDYIKDDVLLININSELVKRSSKENETLDFQFFEKMKDEGKFVYHPSKIFLASDNFIKTTKEKSTLFLDDIYLEETENQKTELDAEEIKIPDLHGEKLKARPSKIFLDIIREREKENSNTYIFLDQKSACDKTARILAENKKLFYIDEACQNNSLKERVSGYAPILITKGRLNQSFDFPPFKISFLDEISLFKKKRGSKTSSEKTSGQIIDISELKPGDFVVHSDHGIARYDGLAHLKIRGLEGDFLRLTYEGDDKLYLPVYRMDLVHRYIGRNSRKPKLSRLGSISWERTKSKAVKAILGMAQGLIKLYAQRKIIDGFAFSKKHEGYSSFESLFPFEETVDQGKTIADVIEDMERHKPMDRLVCGDVGYGKTEVALRAAYKAAMDGKQVAILVPTTILAQQHYETFKRRFKDYPVNIDYLSRFKSRAKQKKSIDLAKSGKTDIIIGTHRLLSSDMKFKDLGLLIIDEEHRFGVNHKEKIKKYRNRIDVLALTATPIPRSLQMSFVGLRDLSLINTPPVDRKAIKTIIARYDKDLIKNAIKKEISRGGQVFFMHNRIETIDKVHKEIKGMLPNLKIGLAHGRMKENKLENVMFEFLKGETDLLLSTAIIESGLDIPKANTIIINRADALGLAQLYQLRGRVGRSRELAFAYLLIPKGGLISPDAHERLKALRSFTELGSGIKIALRDLEIRGAGNIFGAAQSGHIAAIGLEMYTKILERTIKKLKRSSDIEEVEPEMKINIEAFIQDNYISNVGERLVQYKRLAHANNDSQIEEIKEELKDRFGPIPKKLEMLLKIMSLKLLAKKLQAKELFVDKRTIYLRFEDSAQGTGSNIVKALKKGLISHSGEGKLKLNVKEKDPFRRLDEAKKMLLNLA